MSIDTTETAALRVPAAAGEVLLPMARAAISTALGQPSSAAEDAVWLQELGACFVTLTRQRQLRGCIGTLEAHRSLQVDVKSNAVAAALQDTRFAPLTLAELVSTQLEVSVLSPMLALQFHDEAHALVQLRPGLDGVVFEYGCYRSTFLPQVWEQLPDVHQFMDHLKQKAGLPPDFWDAGVRLKRYRVHKWQEKRSS